MLLDTGLEAAAFAWDALGALGASADAFAVEKRELKGSTFFRFRNSWGNLALVGSGAVIKRH